MRCALASLLVISALAAPRSARGDDDPRHGPHASDTQFPSHVFRLRAHEPERAQLAFHFGLSQPIFTHGFNAAVDVRYRRLILTYSHGQGLDYTSFENPVEKAAHATVALPYTTGGGVGVLIVDELWFLVDTKVHHFEVSTPVDHASYTTVTVGAELGWRFFIWKGLNLGFVARYWPNVYSSAGAGVTIHDAKGRALLDPADKQGTQGFLGNVLVGWAFDL